MASEREMRRMVLWGEMTARHVTPHDTLELTPQGGTFGQDFIRFDLNFTWENLVLSSATTRLHQTSTGKNNNLMETHGH